MRADYHSFLEMTSSRIHKEMWWCLFGAGFVSVGKYEVLISVNLRVNVMTTVTYKSHGNMIPNYVLTPHLVVQIDMCICDQLFF